MRIKLIYGILFSSLLLMFGCSKETYVGSGEVQSGTVALSVTFPIPQSLASVDENAIKKFRMIVFTTNSTGYEQGQMVVNKLVYASTPAQSVTIKEIVPIGYLNVYFIANEVDAWNLADVSTIAALKAKTIGFGNSYPVPEFPMFTEYKQIKIDANGNTTQNGDPVVMNTIERNVSKITLKMSCDFGTIPMPITLTEASIVNMPISSTLYPSRFMSSQSSDFFNGAPTVLSIGTNLEATTVGAGGFQTISGGIDFYIPEYLITQASEYTYIYIKGYVTSNPNVKVKYRLPIGNGIGIAGNTPEKLATSGTIDELTITRNMHYTFTANIKSLGEMDGMEVIPGIKPWNPHDVPGDNTAPYLNVSAVAETTYDAAVSRVYFWSNQPSVFVEDMTSDLIPVGVNTIFDRLAGSTAANLHFDAATKSGYVDIVNLAVDGPTQAKIHIRSGLLRREVTITRKISAQAAKKITTPYVGTFHRWNQTGERLVTWSYTGAWTAEVEDPAGLGANVAIDRMPSPAMTNGNLYTDSPADAESYKVSDGKTVNGVNTIYFRVGWKSVAHDPSKPRYARILVKNDGGTVINTLYLRQGEADDYLMRPAGDEGANISAGARPRAVKFSPYNLTAATLNAPVPVRGGKFTDYPTQAGAFWQWANVVNPRYAYSPIASPSSWSSTSPTDYWDALKDTHETCPDGYYRPSDGSTSADNTGYFSDSEMRQSLWLNLPLSTQGSTGNTLGGYYADGYFDRRAITASTSNDSENYTSVSAANSSVAYTGTLFYNPNNYASLFFPAAGLRTPNYGGLEAAGNVGTYWSSSTEVSPSNWCMYILSSTSLMTYQYSNNGLNIRCVKDNKEYPKQHSGWAGSNIYWNGSKLTFYDVNDTSHENYQGVFFKYGSLVALSSLGTTGGSIETIFDPRGAAAVTAWTSVPYISTYTAPAAGRLDIDRAYAYVNHSPSNGTGDICKYITERGWAPGAAQGKKWRMPTGTEIGVTSDYPIRIPSSGDFPTTISPVSKFGTDNVNFGRRYSKVGVNGNPFFPLTGYLSDYDGAIMSAGGGGLYWSSSPKTADALALIVGSFMGGAFTNSRQAGFAIRCVVE